MMSMTSARKRAEEFAAAADGRPTSGSVLAAETREFLALVEQLRSLDTPRPDPQFAADLRSRLVEAAQTQLVSFDVERHVTERRTTQLEPRRRRIMSVAASACIVAASGMGVAAASESALPGDALYPVKRGIEQVELSMAGSPSARGHQYIGSADTRLTEIQGLALTRSDDPETPALMAHTLDEFTAQAKDGATSLIRAYRRDSSEQSIVDLREFADASTVKLDVLGEAVPAEARDELLTAAETLTAIDAAARKACPACSTLTPLTLSGELAALQRNIGADAPASLDPTTSTGNTADPQHQKSSANQTGGTESPPVVVQTTSGTQEPTGATLTTEFTAPPLTSAPTTGLISPPGVTLPTSGLLDPSDAIPTIIDPTTALTTLQLP